MNGREAGVTVPISVDTYHSTVAEQAVDAGADIVNDISAGEDDPEMFSFLAGRKVPVILMHKRGNAVTMDGQTQYEDVVGGSGGVLQAPRGGADGSGSASLEHRGGSWPGVCEEHGPELQADQGHSSLQ